MTSEVHVCPEFLQGFGYTPQPNGAGLILASILILAKSDLKSVLLMFFIFQ